MNIGILGSGVVAKSLGTGFIKHGHEVKLGTSNTSKLDAWQNENGSNASVGSFSEAASFGELLVLAVKGKYSEKILLEAGRDHLKDKTIIDAGNPIDEENPPEDGVLNFYTPANGSLLEELQVSFPEAKFVKAFNSVGAHLMVNPEFEQGTPSMFIAGDDANAKKQVSDILDTFGWEVFDMGSAKAARAIEPLCILWCIPGFKENEWSHAFKLLTK